MKDEFAIESPTDVQQFLAEMPAPSRRNGDALYNGGMVTGLRAELPGFAYRAEVKDSRGVAEVSLFVDQETWDANCSCAQGFDCPHIYAAFRALLTEYRSAAVQALSASGRVGGQAISLRQPNKALPVATLLEEALGRKLIVQERGFALAVHEAYLETVANRALFEHSLVHIPLEWHLRKLSWTRLEIWPAFPVSEHEFWLYVALYAREQGVDIPDFMQPVTDVTLIEQRVKKWRRDRRIQEWRNRLQTQTWDLRPEPAEPSELRVRIEKDKAQLEMWNPAKERFDSFSQGGFRKLVTGVSVGEIRLSPESQSFFQVFNAEYEPVLSFDEEGRLQQLNPLFRLPALASRIVDSDGQPLARPEEPLEWRLLPGAAADDDYALALRTAAGEPPGTILCVLQGSPFLYLTAHTVYKGPVLFPFLDTEHENQVPAAVIETSSGIGFVKRLGAELPPALSKRVVEIPFHVTLHLSLRPASHGRGTEDCQVTALASTLDGRETKLWNGSTWVPQTSAKRVRSGEEIPVADESLLAKLPALLETLKLKPDFMGKALSTRVTKRFPERVADLLKSLPQGVTAHLDGELASIASGDVSGRVKLEVSEAQIDWFDLRVVLDVSDTELTPAEIKLLLNARGDYVRLPGKGWRRLKYDLSEEEDQRLARLGLSPRELSAEPQRLHALQLADEAAKKFLPEEQVQQLQRRATEIKTRVTPEMPAGITAQMRPYQLEGFHFLAYLSANRFGGILADDMGLGKTLQTLTWLLWLRAQPGETVGPSLVVCPKSVMDNWHAEAGRFASGLRVRSWPARDLPEFMANIGSADLHVLNYSQLRSLGESLANVKWLTVILDEGQYIKNPSSQTAQMARKLKAGHRLILSGTPIENRLLDLWSLMSFAMPGVLGTRAQFLKLYDSKSDPLARQRLAARVRPFLLRRTKSQVAKDLPDRVEEDLFCEMDGDQQTLYTAELKRARQMLLKVQTQQDLAEHRFNFLASLLRLRQICCHPRLIQPASTEQGAKAEALLDQLEPLMEEGHKVLVFSQFVELLGLLRPMLEERKWPLFYLAGDTENRGALVNDFQQKEGAAIFLISLKAGGFGLNLTAASYVVLFDPWWNPAVENQAIDRTHRIGQVNKVMAYRLLIKNSIEEKIRLLQRQKKALAEDVFGEEKFAQGLNLQDLEFLFSD